MINSFGFQIHPEGKVPALVDLDGKAVVDSTVIVNYLEEKYPEPTLYNKSTITRDLELLDQYDKVITYLKILAYLIAYKTLIN